MEILELKETKVGELVKTNIKTAHVFKKYGIDFCCGGGVTIEKACEKQHVNFQLLAHDLLKLDNAPDGSPDFAKMELDLLCDYIVEKHHAYVTEAIPMILSYSEKVAKVHGEGHPPVIAICDLFTKVADELTHHMRKEEMVLFPFIKSLVNEKQSGGEPAIAHFGTVQNPIHVMEQEHELAGGLLKEINFLSNNYTPPDWACNTFKAMYAKIDEFEQDLHMHVHLENNILFLKAIQLEKELSKK